MIFDSHAHYNDRQFNNDRDEVLKSLTSGGVGCVMNAADSMKSIPRILEMVEKYPFLYASVGVHPEEVGGLSDGDITLLKEYSSHKKVMAIGEIGLDYYYDDVPRDIQKHWFSRQLSLAEEVGLPVIIHDREAHGDCMDILKGFDMKKIGGVMHCFSGSADMARELAKMGMYLGFGGVTTFKNAKKVREALKATPLDKILVETDCPYLAPEPHRGKRNNSLYIKYVLEEMARILDISPLEIEKITFENAAKLYKIEV